MSFVHDIIKIKYIKEGYLPNHPYHLISDMEMFMAFMQPGGYFETNYPLVDDTMSYEYGVLKGTIAQALFANQGKEIPAWVYSYMLGSCISVNSPQQDIDNLYALLNLDSDGEFGPELAQQCYQISSDWVKRLPEVRPATLFGEPCVIKSLRLSEVDVLN